VTIPDIEDLILGRVPSEDDCGIAMGALVDALCDEGLDEREIERGSLLQRRAIEPCGFVCRSVRRPGHNRLFRAYEPVLVRIGGSGAVAHSSVKADASGKES